MKPITFQLVKTMPSKALILSAAASFALAACSRNPQPGMDETGRADTTAVTDSISRVRPDTATRVTPAPAPTPAPTPNSNIDSTRVRRDTTSMPTPAPTPTPTPMPSPSDSGSRSKVPADSAHVPNSAQQWQGDSAAVNHNVPDSTKSDTTGHH